MNWSQSKLKDFQSMCPRRWETTHLKNLRWPPSEDMKKGLFFEYHCLGSTAKDDGVPELQQLASGKKSMDQLRIEDQVARFHSMFETSSDDYTGHLVTHKQLKLTTEFEGAGAEAIIEGTLDFCSMFGENHFVNDLKLTADLIGGYWSTPREMDHTQAITYSWLYYNEFGVWPTFRYWVFDYSPRKNIKLIDIEFSHETLERVLRLYSQADAHLMEYMAQDEFPVAPVPEQCSRCLAMDCPSRVLKSKFSYERISI